MTVRTDALIPGVMRSLATEGFSSAPVISEFGYEGFIDMLDLVKFVSNMFYGHDQTSWVDFWDKEVRFQRATVTDVMGNKRDKGFFGSPEPVFQENTTLHALEVMATGNAHRVAILDDRFNRKLVGIFTQSMLISEIGQRIHQLNTLRYKTVSAMTEFMRPASSVKETDKAINAFNIMSQQDISGLPVVDERGTLTGAISISDLKCVGNSGEHFHRVFLSVKEFKEWSVQESAGLAPRTHFSRRPVPRRGLFVTPTNSFEDVIRAMDDGNIHRLFVCSAESVRSGNPKPTHVITQTDVLRAIWKHYTYSALV